MKITILLTAKTEDGWVKLGFLQYLKRLEHYCTLEVIEIPAPKQHSKLDTVAQNRAEGELQLAKIYFINKQMKLNVNFLNQH